MANAAHALRVNAVELLRQPGSTRSIQISLPAEQLELHDSRIVGEIVIDLTATSSVDSISVSGTISTPYHCECRRCLVDVDGVSVSEVDELYEHHVSDPDSLQISGDQIELLGLVGEYVTLDLPVAPLCRPDCQGICPVCGTDRNQGECACDSSPTDLRWAALEGLTLDEPGDPPSA